MIKMFAGIVVVNYLVSILTEIDNGYLSGKSLSSPLKGE